jgi:hypothetical protein
MTLDESSALFRRLANDSRIVVVHERYRSLFPSASSLQKVGRIGTRLVKGGILAGVPPVSA